MNVHVPIAIAAAEGDADRDVAITRDVTQAMATESTMLSPRFYTTDFDALDRIDVTPVRREWDALIAEMTADPNKRHFKRTGEFDGVIENLPPALRMEFTDFLVSSMTSEFSGCILYAEIARRVNNPDAKALFKLMAPRLSDQDQEIHLLPAEIHLLRDLSVGKDRLCPLHHHPPAFRKTPGNAFPPDLQMVRSLVQ
jgi:hypothetical protein